MKKVVYFFLATLCLSEARSVSERSDSDRPSLPEMPEIKFRHEHVHRYRYEVQLMSGIPMSSSLHSGLKMTTDVEMYSSSGTGSVSKVYVKMTSPKFYTLLDDLKGQKPSEEMISSSKLTEVSSISDELNQLSRPWKFEMSSSGKITKVEFKSDDPMWSRNIKKGLMSSIQSRIDPYEKKSNTVDQIFKKLNDRLEKTLKPDVMSDSLKSTLRDSKDHVLTYTIIEDDVTGRCETVYTVRPKPDYDRDHHYDMKRLSDKPERIMVTKVKSFENCKDRPEHRFGSISGLTMRKGWNFFPNPPVSSPSLTTIILKRSEGGKYLVEKVIVKGKHVFAPYNEEKGAQETSLRSELELRSNPEQQRPSWIPSSSSSSSDTSYESFSHEKMLQMEIPKRHLLNEYVESGVDQNRLRMMKDLFNDVSSDTYESSKTRDVGYTETDGEEKMMKKVELLNLMRESSKEELHQLRSNLNSESSDEYSPDGITSKRVLFNVLLATCGTPQSVKLLMEDIRRQVPEMSDSSSSSMDDYIKRRVSLVNYLWTLRSVPQPRKEIVDDVMTLCKDFSRKTDSDKDKYFLLEKQCWLTVGSLINRLCYKQRHVLNEFTSLSESRLISEEEMNYMKTQCSDHVISDYASDYKDMLRKDDPDRRGMIVHSIMNSFVMPMSLMDKMFSLIKDRSTPLDIRTSTIMAYSTIGNRMRNELTSLLLPLYRDRSEDETVRATSFMTLLVSNAFPSNSPMLISLVSDLKMEPSPTLKAFVHNTIMNLVNSTAQVLGEEWRKALIPISHMIKDISVRKDIVAGMYRIDHMFHDFNVGLIKDIVIVPSPASIIPRLFISSSYLEAKDYFIPLESFGLSVDRLEQYVKDLIRSSQDSSSSDQGGYRTPPFHIHVDVMANFQNFFTSLFSSKDEMDKYFKGDNSKVYKILDRLTQGMNLRHYWTSMVTMHNQVPSPLGFPIDSNVTIISDVGVKGSLKVDRLPSWSSLLRSLFDSSSQREVSVSADLDSRLSFYAHGMMGPRLPFIMPSSKVHFKAVKNMPVKVDVTLDVSSKTLNLRMKDINKKVRLGGIKVEPSVCIVKRSPSSSSSSRWTYQSKTIFLENRCPRRNFEMQFPPMKEIDGDERQSPALFKIRSSVPINKPEDIGSFPFDGFRKYELIYDGTKLGTSEYDLTIRLESSVFSSNSRSSSDKIPSIRYPDIAHSLRRDSSSSSPSTESLSLPQQLRFILGSSESSSSSSDTPLVYRLIVQLKPKDASPSEALISKLEFQKMKSTRQIVCDLQILNQESSSFSNKLGPFRGCARLEINPDQSSEKTTVRGGLGWGSQSCSEKKIRLSFEHTSKSSKDMDTEYSEIRSEERCDSWYSSKDMCDSLHYLKDWNKMIKGEITSENIPEKMKTKFSKVFEVLMGRFITKQWPSIEVVPESNPDSKISFEVDVRPYWHKDEIRTPRYTIKLQGWPTKGIWVSRFMDLLKVFNPVRRSCTVRTTSDGLSVEHDHLDLKWNSDCEVAVSGDTSYDRRYAVSVSKDSSNKMVKIYLDKKNYKITIKRDSDSSDRLMAEVVKESWSDSTTRQIRKDDMPYSWKDSNDRTICVIRYLESERSIICDCTPVRVEMNMRGYITVESKIPRRERMDLCWSRDLSKTVSLSTDLVSNQCRSTDVSRPDTSSLSQADDWSTRSCEPVNLNDYVERSGKMCFSVQEVKRCPIYCRPSRTESRTINYTCYESNNSEVTRFREKLSNREIPKFNHDDARSTGSSSDNFERSTTYHTECSHE